MRRRLGRSRSTRENGKELVCPPPLRPRPSYIINLIDHEHETLKGQIEELKIALEHAQMARRRKIEYDSVTEKVNTIPSREELEQYVC